MTTNLSSVKESIADAEAAGVKVIGTLVQWMIPQRSEISSDLLFDAMKSEGISLATIDELLPKPVTIRKSFTRTIQNFNARRRRPGGAIREFRKIKIDQPGSVCYGLVSVDPDGTARSFSLDNEGWVALIDGEVRSNEAELKKEISTGMTQMLGAADLRRMLTRWSKSRSGFSTRRGGGSYFVPSDPIAQSEADGLSVVISRLTQGHLMLLPILGGDAATANVSAAFNDSMLAEIESLQKEIKKFFDSPTKKQKGASLKRLDEVKELRKFALSYEALLGPAVQAIKDDLDRLDNFVEQVVSESLEEVSSEAQEETETEAAEESTEESSTSNPSSSEAVQEFLAKLDREASNAGE